MSKSYIYGVKPYYPVAYGYSESERMEIERRRERKRVTTELKAFETMRLREKGWSPEEISKVLLVDEEFARHATLVQSAWNDYNQKGNDVYNLYLSQYGMERRDIWRKGQRPLRLTYKGSGWTGW